VVQLLAHLEVGPLGVRHDRVEELLGLSVVVDVEMRGRVHLPVEILAGELVLAELGRGFVRREDAQHRGQPADDGTAHRAPPVNP
jgi:hypothetical protein